MIRDEVPSRRLPKRVRYAVLLNANAKQWTGNIHEEILRWVPTKDLFLTHDFAQASVIVERVLLSDYDVIFTGGGDGTISFLINQVERFIEEGKIKRSEAPPIGVLKMGTGNALANWLEASDVVQDLRLLRHGSPITAYDVKMIDDGDTLAPFVGFGWDADIINDYDIFKEKAEKTIFGPILTGPLGYAASISARTIPQNIFKESTQIRVTTHADATQVTPDGRVLRHFKAGDVIFEGPSRVFGCGSMPYCGYQLRMFPLANHTPDKFHFRSFNGTIRQIVFNLKDFWNGVVHTDCLDFLCEDIEVELLGESLNYQAAGDPKGRRQSVRWRLAPHPAILAVPTPLPLKH